MHFNASMQRLLRLRRSLERQEEMKLSLASARLFAARSGLEQEQQDSRGHHEALLERLAGQPPAAATAEAEAPGQVYGAELQVAGMQREASQDRQQRLQSQVATLSSAQAAQREALMGRTRERKTLDTLRQHHEDGERREQLRREQAALDEAFLLRKHSRPD